MFLMFDTHQAGLTLVLLPEADPGRERLITEQYVIMITHRCVFMVDSSNDRELSTLIRAHSRVEDFFA